MGLAADQVQTLLNWRLAVLDATEKQAQVQKRQAFDTSWAGALAGLRDRLAEVRGELDALAQEEKRATEPLAEALAACTISFTEARERLAELQALFAELRKAQEETDLKRRCESLTASLRTPEEQARNQIEEYKRLLEGGHITDETYRRAVRKGVEDAAAALPDVARATVAVRGMFSALEAWGLGAGGVTDRIARATEETARNTEKIAQLAANLGVTFH